MRPCWVRWTLKPIRDRNRQDTDRETASCGWGRDLGDAHICQWTGKMAGGCQKLGQPGNRFSLMASKGPSPASSLTSGLWPPEVCCQPAPGDGNLLSAVIQRPLAMHGPGGLEPGLVRPESGFHFNSPKLDQPGTAVAATPESPVLDAIQQGESWVHLPWTHRNVGTHDTLSSLGASGHALGSVQNVPASVLLMAG